MAVRRSHGLAPAVLIEEREDAGGAEPSSEAERPGQDRPAEGEDSESARRGWRGTGPAQPPRERGHPVRTTGLTEEQLEATREELRGGGGPSASGWSRAASSTR